MVAEAHKGLRTGHVTYRPDMPMMYAMDRATPIPCRGIAGEAETGRSVWSEQQSRAAQAPPGGLCNRGPNWPKGQRAETQSEGRRPGGNLSNTGQDGRSRRMRWSASPGGQWSIRWLAGCWGGTALFTYSSTTPCT